MSPSIVIAAGGTGGHLIPALAIAEQVRAARPDATITFVGTRRGLDDELVRKGGFALATTGMRPFGGGVRGALGAASTAPATAQALGVLRRARADAVVGMGGYASLPVVIAARMRGIPSVIHEGNVVPGLANEVASRFTRNVAVSFEPTLQRFPGARVTGMPLRASFASFDRARLRAGAFGALHLDPARRTVLLFGGSLGAARLNEAAAGLMRRWRERADLQLVAIAGRAHADALRARMSSGNLAVSIEPFVDRMDLALAAADVVVCRAGGSTVAELAVAAVPAILVPFPHARRQEQHANAAVLADAGAALVVEDADAGADRIGAAVEDLLDDEQRRGRMSSAAASVARPGAAADIARWVLSLAEAKR